MWGITFADSSKGEMEKYGDFPCDDLIHATIS